MVSLFLVVATARARAREFLPFCLCLDLSIFPNTALIKLHMQLCLIIFWENNSRIKMMLVYVLKTKHSSFFTHTLKK